MADAIPQPSAVTSASEPTLRLSRGDRENRRKGDSQRIKELKKHVRCKFLTLREDGDKHHVHKCVQRNEKLFFTWENIERIKSNIN